MITSFSYRIQSFVFLLILFGVLSASFAKDFETFEPNPTIENKEGEDMEQKLDEWNENEKAGSAKEIGEVEKEHEKTFEKHVVENKIEKEELRFKKEEQKEDSEREQSSNFENKDFELKEANEDSHDNLQSTHFSSEHEPHSNITHQNSSESAHNNESVGHATEDLRIESSTPNEEMEREEERTIGKDEGEELVEVGRNELFPEEKTLKITEEKHDKDVIEDDEEEQEQYEKETESNNSEETAEANQEKSKIEAKEDEAIIENKSADNEEMNDYYEEESENTTPPRTEEPFFPEQTETEQVEIPSILINELENSSNMSSRIPFHKTIFKSPPLIDSSSQIRIDKKKIPAYITLLTALLNYGIKMLPVWIKKEIMEIFYFMIDQFVREIIPLINEWNNIYKEMKKESEESSQVNIWYETNYADRYGGAKILMKSSDNLMSINSILDSNTDKYMYTESALPIRIIIALNEYIAIESIIILSREMYSCITKEFKVEGKFTLDDKKWVSMGTYTAENVFGEQQFYTEKKIFRYIRISIISSYGKWSYFTLTQIQIRGKSLLDDAVTEKKSGSEVEEEFVEHESYGDGDGEVRQSNICIKEEFKSPSSSEPHENNLIGSLITSIDSLKSYNQNQGKEIKYLTEKLKDISSGIETTNLENKFYEKLIEEYKRESSNNYYVIIFSLLLSIITLLALVCMCLLRRKELLLNKVNREKEGNGTVKKSNSFK